MSQRLSASIMGLMIGFGLFFLCYWWLGTITLSALVGGVTAALVALAGRRWRS